MPLGFSAKNSGLLCSLALRLTKMGCQGIFFSASAIRTFWHQGQVGQWYIWIIVNLLWEHHKINLY